VFLTDFGEEIIDRTCTIRSKCAKVVCAYIDVNNCDFANQLCEQGLATDTGLYKTSGFCQYPLWQFSEETLREMDNDVYQQYSDAYDEYMESMYGDEQAEEQNLSM
jgi:hypothetical protein